MPPKGAVKNARKRAHDSPTPDSTSGPKKAKPAASSGTTRPTSTTLASPRKGRQNRDGLGTTTDRPAADQTLKVYASADAVKFLRTSKDCSDYDVRCHYFWAQRFMSARDFNPEERKNLFEGTIPAFAYPPAISAQTSQGFDDVYYTYQAYFAAKVEAYAQKWLQTPAGSSWITAREEAKKKKSSAFRNPANPTGYKQMLQHDGKAGLVWGKTQCTDFFLICLRSLETPYAPIDEVKWLSQEYNGEKWYSELSEVALELIRRFVISYHTTKGGYAPEARTFDLRNVMAPSAGKMHAPLKSMAPGRAPLPVPVETLKACPQPDRDGMIGEAPEFNPEDGVRIKTDIAGSWSPPVPLKQIEGRFNEARDLNAVFTSDFTKNLDGNRARFGTNLPARLPLPDEYYNSDRPLWSPPEVGTTYHMEFSKRFAAADIWGKTLIWQDLIDAEIARIDTQMMAIMNRRQVLEAEKEQGIQHYKEMQRRKEALAQAYRENEIGRREVDAIHKKAEREMKISLKTFGGSGSGIQDKLSRAKRSSGSELLLNASVRAQSPHASFQGGIRGAGVLDTLRRVPAFEDPRTITQQVRSPLGSEFLASVSGGGTKSSFAIQSSPTMDTEQDAQFSDNEEQVTEDEEREEEYGEDVGGQEEEEFDEASRAVPEELESSHMSGSYHHELKPGDPDQPGAPQTEMFESTLTTAGMRENVG